MAGKSVVNTIQLGDSITPTNNFVLKSNVDGSLTLARGNEGATSQDILTVNAAGKVTLAGGNNEIGVDQTWQDVSGSRAHTTSYQNTTGKPIQVAIADSSGSTLQVSTDDATWINIGTFSGTAATFLTAIIPNGYYYRMNGTMTATYWSELR